MTRRRVARLLALGGAGVVAVALMSGIAWSTTRDAVVAEGTARAWPAQEAAIEEALDRVDLPASFAPVACPHDEQLRCWRVDGTPEDALPALVETLTDAAVADVVGECDPAPLIEGDPAGCAASGLVAERAVAFTVSRDISQAAATRKVQAADTSTVGLLADLEQP